MEARFSEDFHLSTTFHLKFKLVFYHERQRTPRLSCPQNLVRCSPSSILRCCAVMGSLKQFKNSRVTLLY